MKKISVLIYCYNEVDNVVPICKAIIKFFADQLPNYEYEIVFIDNCSTDGTRSKIEFLCSNNKKVKAILNIANFGQFNSPFYGICQCTDDCVIPICCDFQDPVEMIPKMVAEWELGYELVIAVKTSSRENPILYLLRSMYYKMIKNMSQIKMIEHFTGFGLYSKSFILLLRKLNDPVPFFRGIVAEYGHNMKILEYTQEKRKFGKTHNNWYTLYDAAMLSITSYTKVGLRIATLLGFLCSGTSIIIAAVYFILKLIYWNTFQAGYTPMIIGIFLLGGLNLFFTGFIGEYILNINTRVIHRPLVIEEKRINFEQNTETESM